MFGDWAMIIVVGIWVAELTGSSSAAAATAATSGSFAPAFMAA